MPEIIGVPVSQSAFALTRCEGLSVSDQALAAALKAAPSIHSLLDQHAARQPAAVALACASANNGWVRVNWARFAEDTCRAASGFRDCGIGSGDHIAILLDNHAAYECLVAYLGLLRRGAVMIPLNLRGTVDELSYSLVSADCQWLIADAGTVASVEAARIGAPNLRGVIGVGGVPKGWDDWRRIAESPVDVAAEVAVTPDTMSSILFTSGTTARPKGAIHTHRSAVATGGIVATGLGLHPGDVFHHPVPFFTSSGAQFTLMPFLWSGCTMVIEPVFESARMVERMVEEGTTVCIGVPAHFVFMLEALRERWAELERVRLWSYGGAPMPAEIVHALAETFPQVWQLQNYGMTETGPTGTMLTPAFTHSKLGSAGRPMPLCETMVVDAAGYVLPIDGVGEICIRSPGNMQGYYRNPEATAATLVNGWVRTGDTGRKDAKGFLFYHDRLKDVINRGGFKISSMEIEDALFRHPAILEAAVVAIPHPQLGEDIRAFVALRPGMNAEIEELREHCAARLAEHKIPRDIRLISALPRNSMGKVQKVELRRTA